MNSESTKTITFIAVAVALSAAAYFTRPVTPHAGDTQVVGQKLFNDFTDSGKVNSVKVVQYDQKASKQRALEVAKVGNVWVIPSHGNYPADADTHLGDAANSLIGLKVLGLAPGFGPGSSSMSPEALRKAYNDYGVVDPEPAESVKSTDTGVGTRITMTGANGRELAAAIVGKTVPEQTNQCYLREPGKEQVYIVALDPAKLSVNFPDWIERNLLNLNTMDLKQARILHTDIKGQMNPRTGDVTLMPVTNSDFRLDLPAGEQPWKLVQELDFDAASHKMVEKKLAADEELNTTALEDLKTALGDLKIVDVQRKPSQVPTDLRVGKLDEKTAEALAMHGFFPAADSDDPNGTFSIYSKSGEMHLQLSDGARYILRFGKTTGETSAEEAAKGNKGAAVKEETSPGMDRYLFVMADFNQDAIAKPVVEQLPPEEKKGEEKKPAEKKPEEKKADEKKVDEKKPDAKAEPKKDDKAAAPAKDAKPDVKKDEPKKVDPVEEAKKAEARAAEKKRIDTDNQRRKDEYDAKVVAGKKHVKDLNERFAQWYYVVPGDVYDKIHLDRKAIVKKKEPPKEEHGHDHEHDHSHDLPLGPAGALDKLPDAPK